MPPKRRSAGAAGATPTTRTQSTLSFNNKSRVTKQSNILPPSTDKKAATKRLSDHISDLDDEEKPTVAEVQTEPEIEPKTKEPEEAVVAEPGVTAADIQPKAEPELESEAPSTTSKPRRKTKKPSLYDSKAKEAEKITEAKIKSYWKAEEDSRLAPRIHQEGVHLHEKILRHFDLSSQYGPCIGITRLERWKRASNLGMEPPVEVLAVLLKEEVKGADRGVGGRQCGQLAYIDELAGGRVVLVE